jgi:hypothetical protein
MTETHLIALGALAAWCFAMWCLVRLMSANAAPAKAPSRNRPADSTDPDCPAALRNCGVGCHSAKDARAALHAKSKADQGKRHVLGLARHRNPVRRGH